MTYFDIGLEWKDRNRVFAWLAIVSMAYLLGDSLPLGGLLLLSLCGAVVVAAVSARLRQVRREAERSAAELRIRSRELEQLRRSAERLAEMAVLEERSRIAHEIHDVVGHTLTAAIVQLEAAKRMAEQQNRVPLDKLELVSGIVRKGLDDVRRAVKLMGSDDEKALPLEAALRELIRFTENTMEVAIEADISLPAKLDLGRLTERALVHALQEGLTNGIRHGDCTRARFSMHTSGGTLRFRLVSDGEPYGSAAPGFGLSSMIERMKLLGGGVDIRSSADDDGNPAGCELSIELPLAA